MPEKRRASSKSTRGMLKRKNDRVKRLPFQTNQTAGAFVPARFRPSFVRGKTIPLRGRAGERGGTFGLSTVP